MSFLDDIVGYGKTAIGLVSGSGIGPTLARTALIGFGLNQITKSINRSNNAATVDKGVRLQIDPSTDTKIPVVYGETYLGGNITDAQLTNSNKTMYYVLTICETTGVKLSDSAASEINFLDVYWNDEKIIFQSDGITADYTIDRNSTLNHKIKGLVKIYLYKNGSSNQVATPLYSITAANAWTIMPGWTSAHTMNNLAFAIVKIDYNKEKEVTGLPKLDFHISNSMTQPGDVLYDYMTNTRYGAGIDPTEIYAS